MIRTRFRKVIVVAPENFDEQLIAGYVNVKHVYSAANVFPAIFESYPELAIFDYDFLGRDLEKILRRIQTNKFYNKIKIYCYKNDPNEKTDSFLKVLGVDQFIYKADLAKTQKQKTVLNTVNAIIDTSIIKLAASVSS
ncbi:hypothetical protein [Mucilaginibacter sp.]|uniref:hypothetical protein n=1 Tax=Mucilaginibacter sp. TaxID=1882438 RepID=UPI002844ABCD|nr:hypothetical protein [Mucilaginibacter sp.]MDR3693127.1 hypothetical protein [Mucilaginibacter sp.]